MLKHILETGVVKSDRTGVGTKSVFGYQLRFDLNQGFPLVTTKKVHMKSIIWELLFFIHGLTNNNWLKQKGVTIWDEWEKPDGDLGKIYGYQWRKWESPNGLRIDQLNNVLQTLKSSPDSRRMIVTAWNPSDLNSMVLPPCHLMFQFGVSEGKLSCHLLMRSWDVFLGGPFNIAGYALLTMMVAQECGLQLGDLVISSVDTHIYLNHIPQVELQLTREPRQLPKMIINPNIKSIFDFEYGDFELINYDPYPAIKASVAI